MNKILGLMAVLTMSGAGMAQAGWAVNVNLGGGGYYPRAVVCQPVRYCAPRVSYYSRPMVVYSSGYNYGYGYNNGCNVRPSSGYYARPYGGGGSTVYYSSYRGGSRPTYYYNSGNDCDRRDRGHDRRYRR
jgi:hypothetical protein